MSGFKYSTYFDAAIELLMRYYDKRPDLAKDIYFAFVDALSYDEHSYDRDYEEENKIIDCLWQHADHGRNNNVTILLLHIITYFLKCSVRRSETNNKNVIMSLFQVVFTEGSKKLRYKMWSILSELYTNDKYRKMVGNAITDNYFFGLKKEDAKTFRLFDLQCIEELFFNKWEHLSLEQCLILSKLEKNAGNAAPEYNRLFQRYTENDDFMIYHTLTQDYLSEKSWQENNAERDKRIGDMVKGYKEEDFAGMFKICKEFEAEGDRNLASGLNIVFSKIEDRPDFYYNIVDIFLQYRLSCGCNAGRIVDTLLKNFGIAKTKQLIESREFPSKHHWLRVVWENASKDILSEELIKEFLTFIKQEAYTDEPDFPKITSLKQYRDIDPDIVKKVSKIIIEASPENSESIAKFLEYAYQDSTIALIIKLFSEEWTLLEELYLRAYGHFFDFDRKLLIKIIEYDISFWHKFTQRLHGEMLGEAFERDVFEMIWGTGNYNDLIQTAYENMLGSDPYFMAESEAEAIFCNSQKTSEKIKQRKKQWIKEFIRKNFNDTDNMKRIFGVIAACLPDDRKEYLLTLTSYTNDYELFKEIPLFASISSWIGSEIPVIEKKIAFLEDLIASLKGIDFIEHRAYLKEMAEAYEEHKQDVLITEYVNDNDIA